VQCGRRHATGKRDPRPQRRKVERPSYEQLVTDLQSMSFVATGRKYGVSDNAVRKWIRRYEYERKAEKSDPPGIPSQTEQAESEQGAAA